MKIFVNYDLLDKAREARCGISLHRFTQAIGLSSSLLFPIRLSAAAIANEPPEEYIPSLLICGFQILSITGFNNLGYAPFNKIKANENLEELSAKLGDIYVDTDAEKLKQARQYDIEYDWNFEKFPPTLEQKKYIMVPVHNEWDNNERSLVQEHTIGTRGYALSYGEPEKQKVYSLGTKRMIGR